MIDKKAFFDKVRKDLFGGALDQGQVDGMNAIVDEGLAEGLALDALAYCLATAYHETAQRMRPVTEYGGTGYWFRMYDPGSPLPARAAAARSMGAQPGDGVKYPGRGYVQLTWRANYRKMGALLGVDLEGNPDLALDKTIAAKIMFVGMKRGSFTGLKLADYFGNGRRDWVNARRIINGLDKAEEIAGQAKVFFAALGGV